MNTYGKKNNMSGGADTGKLGRTPNRCGRCGLCASSPGFNVIAASDQARISCLLAVIPATLDHDKNEEHEGGYVETFKSSRQAFFSQLCFPFPRWQRRGPW